MAVKLGGRPHNTPLHRTETAPCGAAPAGELPGAFAATPEGYVSGPPEALEYVRFGDGWALYDLTDVPERLSPERVAAALKAGQAGRPRRRRKGTAAAEK